MDLNTLNLLKVIQVIFHEETVIFRENVANNQVVHRGTDAPAVLISSQAWLAVNSTTQLCSQLKLK